METKEKIKVFIDFQNGKTVCICKRSRKRCGKNCSPEVVERDKSLNGNAPSIVTASERANRW